jgi:hypothetical protein
MHQVRLGEARQAYGIGSKQHFSTLALQMVLLKVIIRDTLLLIPVSVAWAGFVSGEVICGFAQVEIAPRWLLSFRKRFWVVQMRA